MVEATFDFDWYYESDREWRVTMSIQIPRSEAPKRDTSGALELSRAVQSLWGSKPRIFRAPGRVNLIGEHTDYNDGFVLPAAIELATWVAAVPRAGRKLLVHSDNFSESRELSLEDAPWRRRNDWSDYVAGVATACREAGYQINGADLLIRSEVPIGAGLSSSAALETAVAFALLSLAGEPLDRTRVAMLCQKAENQFVGMRCGIMDQFAACHAQTDHALLLDCRSLEHRLVPMPSRISLAICNTMVHHKLATSAYNQRRAECEAGVLHLAAKLSGIHALRDVTLPQLEQHGRDLPPPLYKRCRHVITENGRVVAAVAALERGDIEAVGQLFEESHQSLRDDYEVSCWELDQMVQIAGSLPGVYGSRMTGGGFGGCTVNLVQREYVGEFRTAMTQRYQEETGTAPTIYVSEAAGGAGEITPD